MFVSIYFKLTLTLRELQDKLPRRDDKTPSVREHAEQLSITEHKATDGKRNVGVATVSYR